MSTEELLKPRYKVIADYPGSPFVLNQVLVQRQAGGHFFCKDEHSEQGELMWSEKRLFRFSGKEKDCAFIFKKLEWWEERQPEEMPQYVKLVEPWQDMKAAVGDVFKVLKYIPEAAFLKVEHLRLSEMRISRLIPATEAEYLTYQKNNQ